MKNKLLCLLAVSCFVSTTLPLPAEETTLIVRVRSKDAKFVGTSMGGALVVVRDATTGAILAQGKTSGSTGNTKVIMREPHVRRVPLSDEKAAGFKAVVDIDEPTLVTVEVSGPLAQGQSAVKSTQQLWLLPGKHVLGDGVIVEISGFALDILTPAAHGRLKLTDDGVTIPLRANLVML